MHGEDISFAYGFWFLVIVNVDLFAFFAALFTKMYGFPLTIYILTGILGSKYPALNPFSHASGHLWLTFLGGGK